jgi:hypothetical protein
VLDKPGDFAAPAPETESHGQKTRRSAPRGKARLHRWTRPDTQHIPRGTPSSAEDGMVHVMYRPVSRGRAPGTYHVPPHLPEKMPRRIPCTGASSTEEPCLHTMYGTLSCGRGYGTCHVRTRLTRKTARYIPCTTPSPVGDASPHTMYGCLSRGRALSAYHVRHPLLRKSGRRIPCSAWSDGLFAVLSPAGTKEKRRLQLCHFQKTEWVMHYAIWDDSVVPGGVSPLSLASQR